jgi:hypothetical protein
MENITAFKLVSAFAVLVILTVGLTQYGILSSDDGLWWFLAAPIGLFVLFLFGLFVVGVGATLFGFLNGRR